MSIRDLETREARTKKTVRQKLVMAAAMHC